MKYHCTYIPKKNLKKSDCILHAVGDFGEPEYLVGGVGAVVVAVDEDYVFLNPTDGTTNKVKGGYEDYPGIYIPQNHTLTIDGSGAIEATGGKYGSGIGSAWQKWCGNITINGGKITAEGGEYGNGIGSGNAYCGTITLGWTNDDDYIYVTGGDSEGTVNIKASQLFVTKNGELITGDNVRIATINSKKLTTASAHSITYHLGDGATNHKDNPDIYYSESPTFALQAPTRDHYEFAGWTYEGQTEPIKEVTIEKGSTDDKEFTAHWRKILTISANANQSKVYGAEDPVLMYDVEGLADGDNAKTVLTGALSREDGNDVGAYAISQGTLAVVGGNYTIVFIGADFEITPANVTVKADDASKVYGGNDPYKFTVTVTGLPDGETITYTVSRTEGEAASEYTITPTVTSATSNYNLKIEPGTFTINPKTIGISWGETSFEYDGKSHTVTATATETVNGEKCELTVENATQTDAGNYTAKVTAY